MNLYNEFERVAALSPQKKALAIPRRVWTYSELKSQIDELSKHFIESGVRAGERIAIIFPNSPEFIVASFAAWKIGAIVLPLHAKSKEKEIIRYLLDCKVKVLVAFSGLPIITAEVKAAVETVATYSEAGFEVLAHKRTQQKEGALAEAALTMYSTGSTGRSKRVTRTQAQLYSEYKAINLVMHFTTDDHILATIPFYHTYGFMNAMLCPLLSGASLFIVTEFFAKDVAQTIEKERITGFPGVPFMFKLLSELNAAADFSSLRYIFSAGALLPEEVSKAFFKKYNVAISQHYGSTETGVITLDNDNHAGGVSAGGLPIPGVTVEILDDDYKAVSPGTNGNIAIRSAHAAISYDGPEQSEGSHFRNGLFLPGDLGKLTNSGHVVIIGRRRNFINVSGNKVDPSEVESVLRKMPSVKEVAVVGVPDEFYGEMVKAVIVSSAPISKLAVIDYCEKELAPFKAPRFIEFRSEIPKSPLGKVLGKYLMDRMEGGSTILTPILRVLATTDGTVTKTLQAYFNEDISVDPIFHGETVEHEDLPEINVIKGDSVIRREVILRGKNTKTIYAIAETFIKQNSLEKRFISQLEKGVIGIGELLRSEKMETYREILENKRAPLGLWAQHIKMSQDEMALFRSYVICHGRQPIVFIREIFPEKSYAENSSDSLKKVS